MAEAHPGRTGRPAVTVIVPFRGGRDAADWAVAQLHRLDLGPEDQIVLSDNSRSRVVSAPKGSGIEVIWSGARPGAYHARNAAARRAKNDWLLFLDADCVYPVDLLSGVLEPPPAAGTAVVAGEVVGSEDVPGLLPRWARSRRGEIARHHLSIGPASAGVAANLLVRRDVFEVLGGFRPTPAADVELCWDAQALGFGFEYRPTARILHGDPRGLRAVLRQARGYGAGLCWSRAAYGKTVPRATLARPLARSIGGAIAWSARGEGERAVFKLIDGASAMASWWGYVTARPHPPAPAKPD